MVGNLFVDLSKSKNEANSMLSNPYIHENLASLKTSVDMLTMSFIMPKNNTLNDYSYMMLDAGRERLLREIFFRLFFKKNLNSHE